MFIASSLILNYSTKCYYYYCLSNPEPGGPAGLAMGRLTEVEAAAFSLRHMEDRTLNEVAELLAISLGSAKQAVFRAVQKLRREMAPLRVKR